MLLLILDLLGVFVFAVSGGLVAVRRRLDVVGVLVLAVVTGLGGGMVRDVLLGSVPPAAFADWRYLAVGAAAGLLTCSFHPEIGRRDRMVNVFDAFGLGLFCVAGAVKAAEHGLGPVPAALLGMVTGVGGGVIRDVLANRVPVVLSTGELYAIPALAGAAVAVAGYESSVPTVLVAVPAAALATGWRLLAMWRGWTVPVPGAGADRARAVGYVEPMSVRTETNGPVTTVVIDRPEARNAVDRPTAEALAEAFRAFDADASQSVAVLTGAGGTFCAGADLKAIGSERGNRVDAEGDGPMGPTRMRLGKPVIAAVEGHAVAGGLELALWCDLRVAAADATFGVFCRRWGVPLIDGGTVRLPRLVGEGRALDLILTGRPVDAEEAHRIGLADRVVPAGTARQAAEELAAELARLPQTCLRNDRMSVLDQAGLSESEALGTEFEHGLGSLEADALEGAQRFAAGAGRHGQPETGS